jgi:adenine/guanine phosphoribosyltransferase-like PRPP-binding protein
MGMVMLIFGFSPAGILPAGAIADRVGVPLVVGIQGALMIAVFAFVWLWRPEIRTQE